MLRFLEAISRRLGLSRGGSLASQRRADAEGFKGPRGERQGEWIAPNDLSFPASTEYAGETGSRDGTRAETGRFSFWNPMRCFYFRLIRSSSRDEGLQLINESMGEDEQPRHRFFFSLSLILSAFFFCLVAEKVDGDFHSYGVWGDGNVARGPMEGASQSRHEDDRRGRQQPLAFCCRVTQQGKEILVFTN